MAGAEHAEEPMSTVVGNDDWPKFLPTMIMRAPGVYGGLDFEIYCGGLYENMVDAEPVWPPTVAITGRATADPALNAAVVQRNDVNESQSKVEQVLRYGVT